MKKNPNKINPYQEKVLSVAAVFEHGNANSVRWDVEILYKKGVLKGSIYKADIINGHNSNDRLKRAKSFYAIINSVVNQNKKHQLKLF